MDGILIIIRGLQLILFSVLINMIKKGEQHKAESEDNNKWAGKPKSRRKASKRKLPEDTQKILMEMLSSKT